MEIPNTLTGSGALPGHTTTGYMQIVDPKKPLLVLDTWWKVALALVACLLVGAIGQQGVAMYQFHNAQHAAVEQFIKNQQTFNQQVAQAINELAPKK